MEDAKKALMLARNLVRIGQVNSVDESKGTVQVLFQDKDDIVTDDLPLLSFEYDIPPVGSQVLCVFLGNGLEQGFCLGRFYSQQLLTPVSNKDIYFKKLDDGVYIKYNRNTKDMEIVNTWGDLLVQAENSLSIQAKSISITSSEDISIQSDKGMSIKRNVNNPDADPEQVSWELI